jgi:hypothetical protein
MRKRPDNWMDVASTVMAARAAARKHVVGLELSPSEAARLPKYLHDVISTLPRQPRRYRSAYLDYPVSEPCLVPVEFPTAVEDFQRVMAAIAKRHHRSVQTLYRWELDLWTMLNEAQPGTLPPRKLRPKKTRTRNKRRPATPPAAFPLCDVPSVRQPYTNLTRTLIGTECGAEDWDRDWILVTAPRQYAKHLRAVGGRWNRKQLGWFVERCRIMPLIDKLEAVQSAVQPMLQ